MRKGNTMNVQPFVKNQQTAYGIRHLQVLLAFFAYTLSFVHRIDLSMTIIAMTMQDRKIESDKTLVFKWEEGTISLLLSSFFFGYLFLQIPAGYMAQHFGAKQVIAIPMCVIGAAKFATPSVIINGGWKLFWCLRFIEGLAQGCFIPGLTTFLGCWLTPEERPRLYGPACSGKVFGSFIGLILSGTLSDSPFGWPSVYYITGTLTVVWIVTWEWLSSSYPATNSFISTEEKDYIENTLKKLSKRTNLTNVSTPWKQIFTSAPFYAVVISHFGRNYGYFIILTQLPRYITGVNNHEIDPIVSGFYAAVPYFFGWIGVYIFSCTANCLVKSETYSETTQRKIWNTIALWGNCAAFILLATIKPRTPEVIVGLLVISLFTNGAVYNGLLANHIDLTRNFTGIVAGCSTLFGSIAGILAPMSVCFFLTDEANVNEWSIIFGLSAAITFAGSIVFLIFGSAEIQQWDYADWDEAE